MELGLVKIAAGTPKVRVADCEMNVSAIKDLIDKAQDRNAKVIVTPQLCVTSCTCGDLFFHSNLLDDAMQGMLEILSYTQDMDIVTIIGMPYEYKNALYDVAVVMHGGNILGIIPKEYIANNSEISEGRYFARGHKKVEYVDIRNHRDENVKVPLGTNILFRCLNNKDMVLGVEIGDDLFVPNPPSVRHALNGATVILNPSASAEWAAKVDYRREHIKNQSARLCCAYAYAAAGEGESTTDLVFSGHNIIAENGHILSQTTRFTTDVTCADIDVEALVNSRRRLGTFEATNDEYVVVDFAYESVKSVTDKDYKLDREIEKLAFIPSNPVKRHRRCEEIFKLQVYGLKKRLEHTKTKTAVIGISGGLDSTLALLVTVRAFDMLRIDRSNIIAVTMPGFGTTDRTYTNAIAMINSLGATFKEISIAEAVLKHFEDIGHNKDVHDVTYENSQARQRTMLLMNIANEYNGIVIGTGDMSELALGWATYNGDHMSMYGVNASVPKTLVRHLVRNYADTCGDDELSEVLLDVLDTPVSPELIPSNDGKIAQKTEDIVGPYELHDFYLYYMLRYGFRPMKICYLATKAFDGMYDKETILKWLKVFYRRFFTQQFKRSCVPDGPKVGSIGLSPRGDLIMPSDAVSRAWLEEMELENE